MTVNGSGRPSVESRAARTVREIFESGRPLTYIRSSEEQRIARVLKEVAGALRSLPVSTWSLTEGMRAENGALVEGTESPRGVLNYIIQGRPGHLSSQGFS